MTGPLVDEFRTLMANPVTAGLEYAAAVSQIRALARPSRAFALTEWERLDAIRGVLDALDEAHSEYGVQVGRRAGR